MTLEKIAEKLYSTIELLQDFASETEDKKEAIEDRADNRASGELTEHEEEKITELEDTLNNIESCLAYIEMAIDELEL